MATAAPDAFASPVQLSEFRSGDPAAILNQVSAAIRKYCGWHIWPSAQVTLRVDGRGSDHLWLPTLHITDVQEVKSSGHVISLDALDWSESGFIELRNGRWSTRPRGIEVSLTHGFMEAPPDLVALASQIALRAVSSPTGLKRQSEGSVSIEFATVDGTGGGLSLFAHEKETLSHYKLPKRV